MAGELFRLTLTLALLTLPLILTLINPHKILQNSIPRLCAAFLILCTGLTQNSTAAEALAPTNSPAPPPFQQWSVGIDAGTTGFGVSGAWRFSDHWGLRVAGDYAEINQSGTEIGDIQYNTKLRLLSEPLTLDVYPWKNRSFHISVGCLINQNELTGTASGNGSIVIDGMTFPTPQVGTLGIKIKQQPVNPYLTIGGNLFYFDHAHRWALASELGVAYTGDPTVTLNRTGPPSALLDAALANEQKRSQTYADQYKWWPVAKLTVVFGF